MIIHDAVTNNTHYAENVYIKRHDSMIALYEGGKVHISGDMKEVALAFLNHTLQDIGTNLVSITYNGALLLKCYKGMPVTIDWVGTDRNLPHLFNEFKQEFERICKMKAFL